MNVLIPVITGVVTFAMSVAASAWISGYRWGEIKTDLSYIKRDLSLLMAMFKLTPNNGDRDRRR